MQMFFDCDVDGSRPVYTGLSLKAVHLIFRKAFLDYVDVLSAADCVSVDGRRRLVEAAGRAYDRRFQRDMIFRDRVKSFLYDEPSEYEKNLFYESLMKDFVWDGSLKGEMRRDNGSADRSE